MPSPLSERIVSALRSVMEGESANDDATLVEYGRTQGWYRIQPAAVAFPRNAADIQAIVGVCRQAGASIIPRGAGTGLAGQGIGTGVVLDTRRHMQKILSLESRSCRVQPGLIHADLNRSLFSTGSWFPIDPTSTAHCTIGGMIATNAGGWHGPAYGSTKDHLQEVTLVLADGSLARFGPLADESSQHLVTAAEGMLRPHEAEIRKRFPDVRKNSSGYNLPGALDGHPVDLRKLIAGSEGTLGIIVEAALSTSPLPIHVGGAVVSVPSAHEATTLLLDILSLRPSAAEFMDHSFLRFAKLPDVMGHSGRGVILYFDFHRTSELEITDCLTRVAEIVKRHARCSCSLLKREAERTAVLKARESASEQLNLDRANKKASFIEDVAVPPSRLHEYVEGLSKILARHGIDAALYGHAADGNIHCSPFVDIRNLEHYRMIDEIASSVADLTIRLGGTLSGEHGDGFVRTPLLERMYGELVYSCFEKVKRLFDPENLFNPGIIVGKQNASILHDITLE